MLDIRNDAQHLVGGMPGSRPSLSLSRFNWIILDFLGDLSETQVYLHKERFMWIYGPKECSSCIFYDLGIGYDFH